MVRGFGGVTRCLGSENIPLVMLIGPHLQAVIAQVHAVSVLVIVIRSLAPLVGRLG
jgi:hypothetical protein